jgi:hypothetical protein
MWKKGITNGRRRGEFRIRWSYNLQSHINLEKISIVYGMGALNLMISLRCWI